MSGNHLARRHYQWVLFICTLAERYPRLYIWLALLFMVLGYAFLLLFPVLVFAGASVLAQALPHVKTAGHWIVVEVWFGILLFCLFLSHRLFQLCFPRIQGVKLSKELAPGLYALLARVRKFASRPAIKAIVLTDQFELRIEETPRFGYPFWTRNTLVVGLPLLQTLSQEQLHSLLTRRLCQYASGRMRPCHWLFRTRLLWRKYLAALGQSQRFGLAPMRWFFSIYTPLFELLTLPAARLDELAADSAALEWLNDRDYFAALKSSIVAEVFLDAYYWRKVHQAALKNPAATLSPFAKLEHVSGHLKSEPFRRKWLQGAFAAEQDFCQPTPALRLRMENIGHSMLRDVPIVEQTAAVACLGDARKNYVPLIDKLWRSTSFAQWKADYEKRCIDIKTVKALSRKSRQQVLGLKEMLRYARLARQLRGDPLTRSWVKILKRNLARLRLSSVLRNPLPRRLKATSRANDIF
jgi:hypothetical protein